jgi:hypothetical protein
MANSTAYAAENFSVGVSIVFCNHCTVQREQYAVEMHCSTQPKDQFGGQNFKGIFGNCTTWHAPSHQRRDHIKAETIGALEKTSHLRARAAPMRSDLRSIVEMAFPESGDRHLLRKKSV